MMCLKRATREGVKMLLMLSTESEKMLMLFEQQPSALDPDLLNLCLEPNFTSDIHPTVQPDLMLEVEEKQRLHQLESLAKQTTDEKIRQCNQFLDRVCAQLGNNKTLDNSNDDDDADPPNTFVYLRSDGEHDNKQHPLPETLWKYFEVPLLDKNGEPCLDDMGSLSLSLQRIQNHCIPHYFSQNLMNMEYDVPEWSK